MGWDSGTGIPQDELPRVFDRFHRVRGARSRSHEGTGIGLALVKDLVTLHGGHIEVESAVGVGTTFRVSIPAGSAHLPAGRIGARTLPSTEVGAAAFVNDALSWLPADRRHDQPLPAPAGGAAGSSSHAVHGRRLLAHDGAAALQACAAFVPEVALLDIGLPLMDGYELAGHLRASYGPALRLIAVTGYVQEKDRVRSEAAGFDDHLAKPVDIDRVCRLVSAERPQ